LSPTNVSNPWREAIEESVRCLNLTGKNLFPILGGRLLKLDYRLTMEELLEFPILGGRLLKESLAEAIAVKQKSVSNPWREAIEGYPE